MEASTGCLIIIGLMIVLSIMFGACPRSGSSSSNRDATNKYNTSNSSWDSSVPCVEEYLKNTLHDPDSYKSYKWSKFEKKPNGTYKVAHEYGAKNRFGGMVREAKWFTYNAKGEILKVEPAHFRN